MSMFGTKGVQEGSLGIKEGIQVATIVKWSTGENANNKPFIAIWLIPKGGDPEKAREFRFFISTDKAIEATNKKILHICTKIVTRASVDAIEPRNAEEYVAGLNRLTAGKSIRLVFDGEEYYKDGKLRVAAKLNRLGDFAEAVEAGAQYPVVAEADTKLVFDYAKHVAKAPTPEFDPTAEELPSDY